MHLLPAASDVQDGGASVLQVAGYLRRAKDPLVPAAPIGLVAEAISTSRVDLSWVDLSDIETGFAAEYSTDEETWLDGGSVAANITVLAVTGLAAATEYFFRVKAVGSAGDSTWTVPVSATTDAVDSPPAAPVIVGATALSASSIRVSWTDQSIDETSFELDHDTDSAFGSPDSITGIAPGTEAHNITGLSAQTLYYARVRAVGPGGNSAWSGTASATTLATGSIAYSFDADTIGLLPSGWAQYQSSTGSFVVSSTVGATGSGQTVASAQPNSTARGWAFPPDTMTADVDVAADHLLGGPFAGVFARGTNPTLATADFYYATVDLAPHVALYKMVSGVRTLLAEVSRDVSFSNSFTTGWSRLTIRCNGSNIRVKLYSYVKNQYFKADGSWDSDPETWCINLTDASIVAGTRVGLMRDVGANTVGRADAFSAADLSGIDSTPPTVSITAPAPSATLTTTSNITVTTGGTPVRVEYWIDGVHQYTIYDSPFTWSFDPAQIDNGSHSLVARAIDAAGNIGTSAAVSFTVTVNRSISLPAFTSKLSWAGGNYVIKGSADAGWGPLMTNTVDSATVVASDIPVVAGYDPLIQCVPYVNITNLYAVNFEDNGLSDWAEYADEAGIDRERGYMHYKTALSYAITSWASGHNAEKLFGSLRLSSGTYTVYQSFGTSALSVVGNSTLPTGTDHLYLSYLEKWDLLRFTSVTANVGYTYTFEYPTAVDANNVPTTWSTLTLAADGSSVFTATGDITWTPPANWLAGRLATTANTTQNQYMYWIRIRVNVGGATQAVGKLTTRNWDGAGNGAGAAATTTISIPAYDTLAAWERYKSRAPFSQYGIFRIAPNTYDDQCRAWLLDWFTRRIAAYTGYSGLFQDNCFGAYSPAANRNLTREPTLGWGRAMSTLLNQLWKNTGSFQFPNVQGGSDASVLAQLRYVPLAFTEFLIRPHEHTATALLTIRSTMAARVAVVNESGATAIQFLNLYNSNKYLSDYSAVDISGFSPTTTAFRGASGLDSVRSYAAAPAAYLRFLTGSLVADGTRQISTYTAATRQFGFASAWSQPPASGDRFVIDMYDAAGVEHTGSSGAAQALAGDSTNKPTAARLQEALAAYYYILFQTGYRFMPFADAYTRGPRACRIQHLEYNVGAPTEVPPALAWVTGVDPSDATRTYSVFKRDFAGARVLYRPLSAAGISQANNSAVSVALGGNYQRVQIDTDGDGLVLGTSASTVSLRNAEGAILVPA